MRKQHFKKVYVLGFDGGSFNVLNPMMELGIMPNLKDLVANGFVSHLDTYITGLGQGWASFMTGSDPTKHGVFYWTLGKGVDSIFIEQDTIWDVLSQNGKTVGILNVPYTYPPKPVNGFLVSGVGSTTRPSKSVVFTYPPELYREMLSSGINYERGWYLSENDDPAKCVKQINNITQLRIQSAKHLLEKYDPEFFMIVFRGFDWIQHYFWKYLEDILSGAVEQESTITKGIKQYYALVDDFIGEIRRIANGEPIFVVSDHGFRKSKAIVNLNEFLRREGYLFLNPAMRKNRANILSANLKAFLKPYYRKLLKFDVVHKLDRDRIDRGVFVTSALDMTRTVAFMDSVFGISINPRLSASLRAGSIRELMAKLENLKFDATGERVFKRSYRKEDLTLEKAYEITPDILLEFEEGFLGGGKMDLSGGTPQVFDTLTDRKFAFGTGIHSRYGILIVSGHGVNRNCELSGPRITDLFPTILNMFNLNYSYSDGRVLREIFK